MLTQRACEQPRSPEMFKPVFHAAVVHIGMARSEPLVVHKHDVSHRPILANTAYDQYGIVDSPSAHIKHALVARLPLHTSGR